MKRYSLTFFSILFIFLLMVLIILINTINYNALSDRLNFRKAVFTFSPQGWAFFTRNARESQVILYTLNENRIVDVNKRHSDISNLLVL